MVAGWEPKPPSMEFHTFRAQVEAMPPGLLAGLRHGQRAVALLRDVHPVLEVSVSHARPVREEVSPFEDDSKIPDFLAWCEENWGAWSDSLASMD